MNVFAKKCKKYALCTSPHVICKHDDRDIVYIIGIFTFNEIDTSNCFDIRGDVGI